MTTKLFIGDFSKMTYLSVKALRRYHDMGLLVPALVDGATGYRYYETSQVPTGQVIRRFRDLGMPLDQVKDVLDAPDVAGRNQLIVAHLRHMEQTLEQTQRTVASLRALLAHTPDAAAAVEYRFEEPTPALAIGETVPMSDIENWWEAAFDELHHALRSSGSQRAGPDGALYASEFFENELGTVVAFVPVRSQGSPLLRAKLIDVPPAEVAVTVHRGAFSELDQAYGALGTFVADREIGVDGPIREHYVVSFEHTDDESQHQTEVCWPVFRTRAPASRTTGEDK